MLPIILTSSFIASLITIGSNPILLNDVLEINDESKIMNSSSLDQESSEQNHSTESNEVGLFVVILIVSAIALWLQYKNKKIRAFIKNNLAFATITQGDIISSPYKGITDPKEFIPIVSNVLSNLRNLIAIYGILLAFIVTIQFENIFNSWIFAIWAGFILAVIARAAHYGFVLADIWTLNDVNDVGIRVHVVNLFYRHSAYMFIPILTLTPLFFLISDEPTVLLFEDVRFVMFSIVVAIGSIFIAFSYVLWFTREGHILTLYVNAFLIFSLVAIAPTQESPLEPYAITIFGSEQMVVSGSIYYFIYFGAPLSGGAILAVFPIAGITHLVRKRSRNGRTIK